ncbi:MAG: hypothetical protein JW776_00835 [Candidatus Lokiarchaeota archaeon]|nr:hypothetical protein [Candidatus Lokiarchaeota archaeon]
MSSKDKLISILDSAFDHGTPFIDYTVDYIYCLIPTSNAVKWKEISYDISGGEFEEKELESELGFAMLCEEIEKGLSMYIEDFMLSKFKEFKESIKDKDDTEKIIEIIKELVNNGSQYSQRLPVINKKESLDIVKGKV